MIVGAKQSVSCWSVYNAVVCGLLSWWLGMEGHAWARTHKHELDLREDGLKPMSILVASVLGHEGVLQS